MSFNFQSVIFFSFFTIGLSDMSKKRGKKKKGKTLLGHQSPVSDTNTSPKLACLCNLGHNILVAFLFI